MRNARNLAATALLLGALVAAEVQAGGSPPKTQLVSRQSQSAGGDGANGDANNPSISASGRFVAFDTDATNLGGPIDDSVSNIYVYDRTRKRVELISRQSRAAGGAGGNGGSGSAEISASGRYVAFSSTSDNLGGSPSGGFLNVYLYDRKRDRVRLISRRSGAGGEAGNDESFAPSVSSSGRFVSYTTEATNLGGPLNTDSGVPESNVYRYDTRKRKTQLVSRRSGQGGAGGDDSSDFSSISPNGRLIAFSSEATNLGGPTQTEADESSVYIRNMRTRKTRLVSRRAGGGAGANGSSLDPFLSANSRYVGFESFATNLGGPIQTDPDDPMAPEANIYVYDLEKRKVALVSRDSKRQGWEGGDGDSDDPVLSRNGRFIAFETNADNLHAPPNPLNVFGDDIYLYDRKRKRVELIGRASGNQGEACDEDCEDPTISYSGRFVAIEAEADNFGGPFDPNFSNRIYVRDRGR